MANIHGIEVSGETYDLEDTTARTTATSASSTATSASNLATTANANANTASQLATTAQATATEADEKATENATAISELQSDMETLDSTVVKKSDITSSVTSDNTNPVSSGGVYNAIVNKLSFKKGSGTSLSDAFDNAGIAKQPTDIYGICNHIATTLIKGSSVPDNTVTLHSYTAGGPAFAIILQKLSTDYGAAIIFNYGVDDIYEFRLTGGNNYHIKMLD